MATVDEQKQVQANLTVFRSALQASATLESRVQQRQSSLGQNLEEELKLTVKKTSTLRSMVVQGHLQL